MTAKPELFPNGIVVQAEIGLEWKDRIRVLFGRKIHFYTNVETEHDAGKSRPKNTNVYVDTIFPRKPIQEMAVTNGK